MRVSTLIFALVVLCLSCSQVEDGELIVIDTYHDTTGKTHIGRGYYIKLPRDFKTGKSYDGAQNKKRTAAVSLKKKNKTISELRAQLSKDRLDYLNEELISINPVKIGDIDSALYIVLENGPKRRMKHQLLLNDGGNETFAISGFVIIDDKSLHRNLMKDILFSVAFGVEKMEEPSFKMAILKEGGKLIYTKDGKYPTEDDTASEIAINTLESLKGDPLTYMKRKSKNYVTTKVIANGKMYMAKTKYENGTKKLIRLLVPDNGSMVYIECDGNEKARFKDFTDFLNNEFLQAFVD